MKKNRWFILVQIKQENIKVCVGTILVFSIIQNVKKIYRKRIWVDQNMLFASKLTVCNLSDIENTKYTHLWEIGCFGIFQTWTWIYARFIYIISGRFWTRF